MSPPITLDSWSNSFLHSGGVNGIVELKVLQAIEKILGPKLPVQLFFDLIAGTR